MVPDRGSEGIQMWAQYIMFCTIAVADVNVTFVMANVLSTQIFMIDRMSSHSVNVHLIFTFKRYKDDANSSHFT